MRNKHKKLIAAFAIVCAAFAFGACGDGEASSVSSIPSKGAPSVADYSIDLSSAEVGIVGLDGYEVTSVVEKTADGDVTLTVGSDFYSVDGYNVFESEYVATLALGTHHYEVSTPEGAASFAVTVTDRADPRYTFNGGVKTIFATVGEEISLPKAVKNENSAQNFTVGYQLNGSAAEDEAVTLEEGEHSYKAIYTRGTESFEDEITIRVLKEENYFVEALSAKNDGLFEKNSYANQTAYDEESGVIALTQKISTGEARAFFLDEKLVTKASAAGCSMISFVARASRETKLTVAPYELSEKSEASDFAKSLSLTTEWKAYHVFFKSLAPATLNGIALAFTPEAAATVELKEFTFDDEETARENYSQVVLEKQNWAIEGNNVINRLSNGENGELLYTMYECIKYSSGAILGYSLYLNEAVIAEAKRLGYTDISLSFSSHSYESGEPTSNRYNGDAWILHQLENGGYPNCSLIADEVKNLSIGLKFVPEAFGIRFDNSDLYSENADRHKSTVITITEVIFS